MNNNDIIRERTFVDTNVIKEQTNIISNEINLYSGLILRSFAFLNTFFLMFTLCLSFDESFK